MARQEAGHALKNLKKQVASEVRQNPARLRAARDQVQLHQGTVNLAEKTATLPKGLTRPAFVMTAPYPFNMKSNGRIDQDQAGCPDNRRIAFGSASLHSSQAGYCSGAGPILSMS